MAIYGLVMQNLQAISRKKILVVVAHPDDETLWFFQSIQQLKENNQLLILCMTHAAISKRGKELQAVADKYALKIIFGHCEDTGINRLLKQQEVQQAFIKVFSKYKFDLVITHPPHGGEKPHPHHLQVYLAAKDFSKYYHFAFGFFCEQKLLQEIEPGNSCIFNFKKKKYVLSRIIAGYRLMTEERQRLGFVLSMIFDVLFTQSKFFGFETKVNTSLKQKALKQFSSQKEILKTYNSFYEKSEYLFLQYTDKTQNSA